MDRKEYLLPLFFSAPPPPSLYCTCPPPLQPSPLPSPVTPPNLPRAPAETRLAESVGSRPGVFDQGPDPRVHRVPVRLLLRERAEETRRPGGAGGGAGEGGPGAVRLGLRVPLVFERVREGRRGRTAERHRVGASAGEEPG